jgi:peptidoglycan/xylan/chitin deacetylase (PgdA/CDA1 family)
VLIIYLSLYQIFFFKNNKGIIFLLFHSVFKNQKELEYNHIDPQWGFTLNEFKYIIEKFLCNGYNFISHKQLLDLDKLNENKKYIYLHFDDGYYNNHNILDLLEEYKIPAHFYIVTSNMINNQKFWWDFLFHQASFLKKNYKLNNEFNYLQNKNFDFIQNYIVKKYGTNSLNPLSDVDRPFSPKELKLFNSNKFVFIGNHTVDHSNLNFLDYKKSKNKIERAEKDLENILGVTEKIFSFPVSKSNINHYKILQSLNFQYAFSDKFKVYDNKNILKQEKYHLGRFCFVRSKNLDWQIKLCMSKFSPYLFLSNLLQ